MKFLTYAAPAIRNAMMDMVRDAFATFEQRMVTEDKDGICYQRVSLDDVLPGEEQLRRIEAIADPYAMQPQSIMAVSYTHPRWQSPCPWRLWGSAGGGCRPRSRTQADKPCRPGSEPVSYTHLDVYKRQVKGIAQAGLSQTHSNESGIPCVDTVPPAPGSVVADILSPGCLLYTSRCV